MEAKCTVFFLTSKNGVLHPSHCCLKKTIYKNYEYIEINRIFGELFFLIQITKIDKHSLFSFLKRKFEFQIYLFTILKPLNYI